MSYLQERFKRALTRIQREHGHLLSSTSKKLNEGVRVRVCGQFDAIVCSPKNQDFDLTQNTWVFDKNRGMKVCYSNHQLTVLADQSS